MSTSQRTPPALDASGPRQHPTCVVQRALAGSAWEGIVFPRRTAIKNMVHWRENRATIRRKSMTSGALGNPRPNPPRKGEGAREAHVIENRTLLKIALFYESHIARQKKKGPFRRMAPSCHHNQVASNNNRRITRRHVGESPALVHRQPRPSGRRPVPVPVPMQPKDRALRPP